MLILGVADRLCVPSAPPASVGDTASAPRVRRPSLSCGPTPAAPTARSRPSQREALAHALRLADAELLDAAIDQTDAVLSDRPMDAEARFVRGLVQLASGDVRGATASMRAALYADPSFAVAAFALGRAHDANGDRTAARSAYQRAMRCLSHGDDRHGRLLHRIDASNVADACRVRLRALDKDAAPAAS